mmetsp:Transcript_20889/g.32771  ORF Transcript_20889/g.32771 Transcript_20889/m.32771 type:complete len:276 (-) Transcript_20889:1136-1963(-)
MSQVSGKNDLDEVGPEALGHVRLQVGQQVELGPGHEPRGLRRVEVLQHAHVVVGHGHRVRHLDQVAVVEPRVAVVVADGPQHQRERLQPVHHLPDLLVLQELQHGERDVRAVGGVVVDVPPGGVRVEAVAALALQQEGGHAPRLQVQVRHAVVVAEPRHAHRPQRLPPAARLQLQHAEAPGEPVGRRQVGAQLGHGVRPHRRVGEHLHADPVRHGVVVGHHQLLRAQALEVADGLGHLLLAPLGGSRLQLVAFNGLSKGEIQGHNFAHNSAVVFQ